MKKNTRIISCAIQKGGCGKTLASLNLAYSLAKKGYKVLLQDLDPQATSTLLLNIDISDTSILGVQDALEHTMLNMMGEEKFDIEFIKKCIVRPTFPKAKLARGKYQVEEQKFGFDLMPTRIELSNYDLALSSFEVNGSSVGGLVLKTLNEAISKELDYDFIIIDVLPGLNMLAYNAVASSYNGGVIMVINMDRSAITGGENLLRCTTEIQEILWDRYKIKHNGILGVLKNRYAPRLKVTHEIDENLFNYFGPAHIFKSTIPSRASCDKAHAARRLYAEYDSEVGNIFEGLADEVVKQIAVRDKENEPVFIRKFGHEYISEQ